MDIFIYWFSQVPNVIWSAIITSLLTFLGVMWTNKGKERRQVILFQYKKEKFQSKQKLTLKKKCF